MRRPCVVRSEGGPRPAARITLPIKHGIGIKLPDAATAPARACLTRQHQCIMKIWS